MRGRGGGAYNGASDIAINTWQASAVFSLAAGGCRTRKDKAWIKVTSPSVWSLTSSDATGDRYEEAADKLMGRRITAAPCVRQIDFLME